MNRDGVPCLSTGAATVFFIELIDQQTHSSRKPQVSRNWSTFLGHIVNLNGIRIEWYVVLDLQRFKLDPVTLADHVAVTLVADTLGHGVAREVVRLGRTVSTDTSTTASAVVNAVDERELRPASSAAGLFRLPLGAWYGVF